MASRGNVIIINSDAQFNSEFEKNSNKLVIIDFTASWCGPCKRIAPVFEQLSNQFMAAVFLKVDVDICRGTATKHGIQAMPTFLFFVHGQKVDEIKGADPASLQQKIQQWALQSSQSPVDSAKVDRGRQLDCFRELLENPPDTFDIVSQLLLRIANNIAQEPNEPKYRTLKLSTNTFQNKLLPVKGAVECLFAMGFEDPKSAVESSRSSFPAYSKSAFKHDKEADQVVLKSGKPLDDLMMIRDTILDERNKREVLLKTMQKT